MVEIDETKGYSSSAYNYDSSNLTKTLDDLKSDSIRSNLQNEIRAASSPEQLSEIESKIKNNPDLEAPEESVLFSQIDGQKTKIKSNLIATAANHIDVQNIGENDFSTIEAAQAKFEKAKNGDFGNNTEAQAIWNSSDEATRATIVERMQENVRDAERKITFINASNDKKRQIKNDEIYTDIKEELRKPDPDPNMIQKINEADFKGVDGESFRSQLLDLAGRRARGEIISDSAPIIYRDIDQGIKTKRINSVTQKFTLPSEVGKEGFANRVSFTEGKSILDRQGVTISDQNADDFEKDIRTFQNAATSVEQAKRAKDLARFKVFLDLNKQLVLGNKAYVNFDPTGDTRFYDFTQQMRIRFIEGLEKGISVDSLLNPRDKNNYILKDDDYYAITIEQQLNNIASGFEDAESPTLDDLRPPQRLPGETPAQYYESDRYKLYVTSGKQKLFEQMMLEAD